MYHEAAKIVKPKMDYLTVQTARSVGVPGRAKSLPRYTADISGVFQQISLPTTVNGRRARVRVCTLLAVRRVEVALRQLSEAEEELKKAQAVLDELNRQFQEALASKRELEQRAQATKRRIEQANKLINGLAGEKARWYADGGVRPLGGDPSVS